MKLIAGQLAFEELTEDKETIAEITLTKCFYTYQASFGKAPMAKTKTKG